MAGIAARAILLPLTHGQDFVVWDLASQATLRGINIYAHHPPYPGGPYAYPPAFLYLELPWQWLATHTGVSFTILGKLPIVAADLLVGWLLGRRVLAAGASDSAAATTVALYLLNPLVLYNGAFYGRFDSVAIAALLVATSWYRPTARRWGFALWFAAAVAIKIFPIVVLPRLLAAGRATGTRVVLALLAVIGLLTLPYLIASPAAVLHDVVVYDASKPPQALSWQQLIVRLADPATAQLMSRALFAVLAIALVWAALRIPDLERYTLLAIVLFLLASPLVLEQYLLWPMPWLILAAALTPERAAFDRIAALTVLAGLTVVGMVVNPYIQPFGSHPVAVTVILALGLAGYVLTTVGPVRAGRFRPRPLPAGCESD